MPKLTIKTAYLDKLKQLGVYDQWLFNMKKRFDNHPDFDFLSTKLYNAKSFHTFVSSSFLWNNTPENHTFWYKIADS